MISEIFQTFVFIIKSLIVAIVLAIVFELLVTLTYTYFSGNDAIHYLTGSYNSNLSYIPDYMNSILRSCNYYLNYSIAYVGLDSYHFSKVIKLSFLIYLEKLYIALTSLAIYFFILLICIYDGWIAREVRRYRAGTESVRRSEFENYTRIGEIIMFTGYMSIPFYIPPAPWFLFWGFLCGYLHRMKFEYIQKYL